MDSEKTMRRISGSFLLGALIFAASAAPAQDRAEKIGNPCGRMLELVADVPMPGPAVVSITRVWMRSMGGFISRI